MLEFEEVSKRFGALAAVDAVTLAVPRGAFVALVGESGSGKSTLLKMANRLIEPDAGRVLVGGADVREADAPELRRRIGYVFQSIGLFPHMDVARNIGIGPRLEGKPVGDERIAEMLALVRLGAQARSRPAQISGGQSQRVALARALIKRPKVLLLDEPLAALDKKLREHTQFELANVQDRLGVTFIVVTHDQEEAMTLSTRIAVMEAGRFVQIGTPGEIYENPNSRFSGFIRSPGSLRRIATCQTSAQKAAVIATAIAP